MIFVEKRYWRYAFYRGYLNLIADASRYYLGWLWWVLEPLAMTAVFYVVFRFLRARDEDFVYFLIVGVTTWLWFSNSVSNATQSLNSAKSLITQMKVPKPLFPLINVITGTYKQAFVFAILFVVVGIALGSSPFWLFLPVLISLEFLMIAATAGTVAFLCAWLPDLRFVIAAGLQLMMFCSGIFFDINDFPEHVQPWFWLNPMAVLLEQYRLVLLYAQTPDLTWCLQMTVVCVAWIAILDRVYKRCDHFLTRRIIA